MEHYLMMDRWVRTIRGCYAWRNLTLTMPGGPKADALADVDAWIADTLGRIRDECTEF